MKLWYNQSLVESEDAPFENGWMTGRGIFETIRTIDGLPLALPRHMRRAIKSGIQVGITIPIEDRIFAAVSEVIECNPCENGRLRISFSYDGNWLITHDEYVDLISPANLQVSTYRFDSEISPPKRFPYTYRLDILEGAKEAGYDDAIVCNSRNNICESSISNLLLYMDGHWITPPLSDGLLAGVIRALVIEKLSIIVRTVPLEEMETIVGAILLSSLKIAQPVESIGDRKLPELAISQSLSAQIRAMVIASSVR